MRGEEAVRSKAPIRELNIRDSVIVSPSTGGCIRVISVGGVEYISPSQARDFANALLEMVGDE